MNKSLVKLLCLLALIVIATVLAMNLQTPIVSAGKAESQKVFELRSLLRAGGAMDDGKYKEALRLCNSVLRLFPDSKDAMRLKGMILMRKNKHAEAEEVFRQLVFLDPNSGTYFAFLGLSLFNQKRYDAALKEAEKAYQLDKNLPSAAFLLKEIYLKRNDAENTAKYDKILQDIMSVQNE